MTSYHTLRLCAGRGGFEAIPARALRLDLAEVRRKLEGAGISVVDARVMLIAKFEREVTVARDGRLLIKSRSRDEAARIFGKLRALLGFGPGRFSE